MDLTRELNITRKLFTLVTFILYRILPSTATQNIATGEIPTIGLINRLINPDVAVGSLAQAFKSPKFKAMASPLVFTVKVNTGKHG